jgi:hypothetical protein
MRVCQPGPPVLKNSVTSDDSRMAVAVLRGFFVVRADLGRDAIQ